MSCPSEPKKESHRCEVFQFDFSKVKKHENADTLGIFNIVGDYNYVLKLDDWKDKSGCLVAWLPPDTLISCKWPQVSFLASEAKYGPEKDLIRIKGKRLRETMSYGVLAELPSDCGLKEGDDASEYFKTDWYSPEVAQAVGNKTFFVSGEIAEAPSGNYHYYDIDSAEKYARKIFIEGEPCLVMEKLEGENSTFVFQDGQMNCRSRTQWKKEWSTPPKITLEELIQKIGDEEKAKAVFEKAVTQFKPSKSSWWTALEACPQIRNFCIANPGYAIYAEKFGHIKKFFYGSAQPRLLLAAFDILQPNGQWMDSEDMLSQFSKYQIPTAPIINKGFPFDFDKLKDMVTDMKSLWPGAEKQISEGLCFRPIKERWDSKIGRVHLKLKNPSYLEMK